MRQPDLKRLLDDPALSQDLRLGLQELHSRAPAPDQVARIVAGLSVAGVAVTAGTAQASTLSTVGTATAAKAVPTVGKLAIWKWVLLAIVPAGAGLVVAVLPKNERPHSASSSPMQSVAAPAVSSASMGGFGKASNATTTTKGSAGVGLPASEPVRDQQTNQPASEGNSGVPTRTATSQQVAEGASTMAHRADAPRDSVGRNVTSLSVEAKKNGVIGPSTDVPARSEVALLQTASTVLGANPAEALQLCEEHRKFYPGGAMSQEREMIAVTALVRLGRQEEAYARAEQFRRNYPKSAYLRQIDKVSPPR